MARNMEVYHQMRAVSWKRKAVSSRLTIKTLKQMIGELREGRDKWRRMYEDERSKRLAAEERVRELELELESKKKSKPSQRSASPPGTASTPN